MSFGPNPWQQLHWDWRAATNFMAGGTGGGLIVAAALLGPASALAPVGAAIVGVGLFAVWLEIGRPLRALNVFRQGRRSWMTREAIVAPLLFAAVAVAALGVPGFGLVAGVLGLAFVYCQGRILQAAKGIPAWREPLLVPLIVATAVAEGSGAWLMLQAPFAVASFVPWIGFALALVARLVLWQAWRRRIRPAARAAAAIDAAGSVFKIASLVALGIAVVVVVLPLAAPAERALQVLGGVLAIGGGLWFKFTLVTRGGFNQGFAISHLPVRGVPRRSET